MLESIGKLRDNALSIFTRRKRKADELTEMPSENKEMKLESMSDNTNIARDMCFQDPDVLCHILSFSNNPSIVRVSRSFYHASIENLRQEYNLKKEAKRASFYVEKDGSNQAVVEQQRIVELYLKKSDSLSGEITNEVIACFTKLREKLNRIEPFELRKFLYREYLLKEITQAKCIKGSAPKSKIDSFCKKLFDELKIKGVEYIAENVLAKDELRLPLSMVEEIYMTHPFYVRALARNNKKRWWHLR